MAINSQRIFSDLDFEGEKMDLFIFIAAVVAMGFFAVEAKRDIKKIITSSKMTAEEKDKQWPDPFHPEMRVWSVLCGVVEEGKKGLWIAVIVVGSLAMAGLEVPVRDIFLLFLVFPLRGARAGVKRRTFLPFQWREVTLPGVNIPAEMDRKQLEYFSKIFWPKFWPFWREYAREVFAREVK